MYCTVQGMQQYNQYFIAILNGVVYHYVIHLKLIYCKSITLKKNEKNNWKLPTSRASLRHSSSQNSYVPQQRQFKNMLSKTYYTTA